MRSRGTSIKGTYSYREEEWARAEWKQVSFEHISFSYKQKNIKYFDRAKSCDIAHPDITRELGTRNTDVAKPTMSTMMAEPWSVSALSGRFARSFPLQTCQGLSWVEREQLCIQDSMIKALKTKIYVRATVFQNISAALFRIRSTPSIVPIAIKTYHSLLLI